MCGQGQGRTADLPLFSWRPPSPGLVLLLCWPEQPWSAVAPGPRSQRAYPRSEDGNPLGQPPIRLPQRPAREWRSVTNETCADRSNHPYRRVCAGRPADSVAVGDEPYLPAMCVLSLANCEFGESRQRGRSSLVGDLAGVTGRKETARPAPAWPVPPRAPGPDHSLAPARR